MKLEFTYIYLSEQLPEQQGLKQDVSRVCFESYDKLSEQLPEQQGLKLHYIMLLFLLGLTFRTTSRTTRIETKRSVILNKPII